MVAFTRLDLLHKLTAVEGPKGVPVARVGNLTFKAVKEKVEELVNVHLDGNVNLLIVVRLNAGNNIGRVNVFVPSVLHGRKELGQLADKRLTRAASPRAIHGEYEVAKSQVHEELREEGIQIARIGEIPQTGVPYI